MTAAPCFSRYVAIGDSTTEGLEDPAPGKGYRNWANRLAERLAALNPEFRYANLAIRGRLAGAIRAEQLAPALALEPDLSTVVAGLNDALRPGFDPAHVEADLDAMIGSLRGAGATVATFTMPDPGQLGPAGRLARSRIGALNDATRRVAARHGALVIDFAGRGFTSDPRLWSPDRLHANADGHARIAAAFAEALGLPGADDSWTAPLPPGPTPALPRVVAAEAAWTARHLGPWIVRRIRGRSSGDGITPKRPALAPIEPAGR